MKEKSHQLDPQRPEKVKKRVAHSGKCTRSSDAFMDIPELRVSTETHPS
jgi:hypothetical protein